MSTQAHQNQHPPNRNSTIDLRNTPGLRETFLKISAAAKYPRTTVLFLGETGVGKNELVKLFHSLSARKDKCLVTTNMGGIQRDSAMLTSQLFGHEKGAYTGAAIQRKGLFEQADGGTIFLDEIANTPAEVQDKLLHVLEDRTFRRLGGSDDITVDVRIIAATSADLQKLIQDGLFRKDLYYRLIQQIIIVPPLRERLNDLEKLAELFAVSFAIDQDKKAKKLTPDALDALKKYTFPGNIRELMNMISQAYLESDSKQSDVIDVGHLMFPKQYFQETLQNTPENQTPQPPSDIPDNPDDIIAALSRLASIKTLHEVVRESKKRIIFDVAQKEAYILTKIAQTLEITSPTLRAAISKLFDIPNQRGLQERFQEAAPLPDTYGEYGGLISSLVQESHNSIKTLYSIRMTAERNIIKNAINENDGNIAKAARYVGIRRSDIYKKLENNPSGF